MGRARQAGGKIDYRSTHTTSSSTTIITKIYIYQIEYIPLRIYVRRTLIPKGNDYDVSSERSTKEDEYQQIDFVAHLPAIPPRWAS